MNQHLGKTESSIDKDKDYEALIDFLKNQDVETCINSLFVLMDSKKAEDSLKSLMNRLRISKNDVVSFMLIVLNKNIEEYEESMRHSRSY